MANWLFFHKVIHHDFCDVLGPLNRILSAAMNAFRPPLIKTVTSLMLNWRAPWLLLGSADAAPEFPLLSFQRMQ